jgi:hypothetical protein
VYTQKLFPDPHHLSDGYHGYAVEDTLVVPAGIPAGDYVLGWRWGKWPSLRYPAFISQPSLLSLHSYPAFTAFAQPSLPGLHFSVADF